MKEVLFKCYWNENKECVNWMECDGCDLQPANEDKPNGRKPPVKLKFVRDIDYCTGKPTGEIPECPSCGEMPYSTEVCKFCGQRFIQDDKVKEYNKPAPTVELECPVCGGKFIGSRSKYNNHFHGKCESCGTVIME